MTNQETDDDMRDYVRNLFAPDEPDETETDQTDDGPAKPPNFVAREGTTPQPPADDGMRAFTKALFGLDPNA